MQQFHQLLSSFSNELDVVMRDNQAEVAKAERRAKREARRVGGSSIMRNRQLCLPTMFMRGNLYVARINAVAFCCLAPGGQGCGRCRQRIRH